MSAQDSFLFDAPLTETPVVHFVKPAMEVRDLLNDGPALIMAAQAWLATGPDDISIDEVLAGLNIPLWSVVAFHRARIIDALIASDGPPAFQGYQAAHGIRFRRLAPLEQCRGENCEAITRGGKLCPKCRENEEYDLWNQR